ncbi:basic proline-rich protein-like [Penaeus chinensis]|uniref:basic proline-rich protein-like n=1 Tax=Penaeus chinensis TaxID=139456 RepID=UPI001FB7DDC6|nr:basic proline-rich protein-like [Penaeus chinensis]
MKVRAKQRKDRTPVVRRAAFRTGEGRDDGRDVSGTEGTMIRLYADAGPWLKMDNEWPEEPLAKPDWNDRAREPPGLPARGRPPFCRIVLPPSPPPGFRRPLGRLCWPPVGPSIAPSTSGRPTPPVCRRPPPQGNRRASRMDCLLGGPKGSDERSPPGGRTGRATSGRAAGRPEPPMRDRESDGRTDGRPRERRGPPREAEWLPPVCRSRPSCRPPLAARMATNGRQTSGSDPGRPDHWHA